MLAKTDLVNIGLKQQQMQQMQQFKKRFLVWGKRQH